MSVSFNISVSRLRSIHLKGIERSREARYPSLILIQSFSYASFHLKINKFILSFLLSLMKELTTLSCELQQSNLMLILWSINFMLTIYPC